MLKVSGSKPLPVRSVIQKGYKIPFHILPPTTSSLPCKAQQDKTSPTYQAIKTKTCSLIIKQAIEEAKEPGFCLRIFTISKKTGDLCPVLNLCSLNQYIPLKHFNMESIHHVCHM
ncbi:hypothetical protein BDF14DRAFT_1775135 [Spinellus fusiger]|nr:hypothetical protein BDF14DRAFT_1775135 [Spinellus fusiger]